MLRHWTGRSTGTSPGRTVLRAEPREEGVTSIEKDSEPATDARKFAGQRKAIDTAPARLDVSP